MKDIDSFKTRDAIIDFKIAVRYYKDKFIKESRKKSIDLIAKQTGEKLALSGYKLKSVKLAYKDFDFGMYEGICFAVEGFKDKYASILPLIISEYEKECKKTDDLKFLINKIGRVRSLEKVKKIIKLNKDIITIIEKEKSK